MDLEKKLEILSDSAKYDVSCSSSGSTRTSNTGVGSCSNAGICHSWSEDGRCISLLKVLYTNDCVYDCAYCINRSSNDIKRASFTPEELASLTINFYRRNYIEGLFLSSAVLKNPDFTSELLLETVKLLRFKYNFHGYIHVKGIPGTSNILINKLGFLVDRLSINMELPSRESLKLLAPQKSFEKILLPMKDIHNNIVENTELSKFRHHEKFLPAGQTTQMIIGATNDSDFKILSLSQGLYDNYKLKRVYFSAYVPVNSSSNLPAITSQSPLLREHRLYQSDWLLRFYGFKADEIVSRDNPFLERDLDPKSSWAIRNYDHFPVEINKADYYTLLRVPGLGINSARRIIKARKFGPLSYDDLKKIRVVLKRARYFITVSGKYYGGFDNPEFIKERLLDNNKFFNDFNQISIYNMKGVSV